MGPSQVKAFKQVCGTFVVLIVRAGTHSTLQERLNTAELFSLLPVRKPVERNEAAHLGFPNFTQQKQESDTQLHQLCLFSPLSKARIRHVDPSFFGSSGHADMSVVSV